MARRILTLDQSIARLRTYNLVAGGLHLVQAAAFVVVLTQLSDQVTFPVTADYLAGPPGVPIAPERVVLVDINVGVGVVIFFTIAALFHFLVSIPAVFDRYSSGLKNQFNNFRWVEYSLSSSIIIWLVAQITGITDVAALFLIFGLNAAMVLFGALQEKYERPGNSRLLPFLFGCMTGSVPWIVILIYFFRPGSTGEAGPPAFLSGIIISLLLIAAAFAVNQMLQYKQIGGWKNYLHGERTYIVLSLVAKTALAWQVFFGAIIPTITG